VNIFLRELKANVRSLIIWGAIVGLFVLVGFSKFSAYAENPEMLAVLDGMPPALLAAFNMNAFNLTTVEGFFGVMFSYFGLLLSIAAAMWGSDIISKEERDRTVEFALTLPVTRARVVTAKTLAALANCVGLLLITWGVTLVAVARYEPGDGFYRFLTLGMVALFLMELIFLALGVFLACAMRHYKRAGTVAVSVLLGTYFLSILSSLNENLTFLKWFTPFKYFDPGALLRESRIDPSFVLISLGVVAACLVAGYLSYQKRDLYI
jgi:ABC-2 type transport system permease protein